MITTKAVFLQSATQLSKLPATHLPEYAFIGRSNVGKSSLINMLLQHEIAKISSTPGKTQTINHFLINNTWYLVDLPGYGYAKLSKTMRQTFEKMIRNYLLKRENLMCCYLLIDSRHQPLENDIEFCNWLGENGIPFRLIFTKTDKIGSNVLKTNIQNYQNKLLEFWEELPTIIPTSSMNKMGREEILKEILHFNTLFEPPIIENNDGNT